MTDVAVAATDPLGGDVPPEVPYGSVTGNFVLFLADSADAGLVPDEKALTGTVILTPLTKMIRYTTTSPPRTAWIDTVTCPVVAGVMCSPDNDPAGVVVIATDQPAGTPDTCQWQASFKFDGVSVQPNPVTFNVPSGGVVDLTLLVPVPPEPPTVLVVSHADALAAQASAEAAAASAQEAADIAAGIDQGPKGDPGTPATVAVGNVVTGAPGSPVTVVDTNPDPSTAVFDFSIPQGNQGNKGDKGDIGPQGIPGLVVLLATDPDPNPNVSGILYVRKVF